MGKKVLITGADGFIGSHLTELMVSKGYKVTAFTYYNSYNSNGWLDKIPLSTRKKINIISGDIRDFNRVSEAAKSCDLIFHLAALIAIPYSYHAPQSYVDVNVSGTLNILQAAKNHKTSRVLITSTSEVYGTAKYVPIDENHPLQGQSPYSASKIGADKIAESYYRSFGLPVTIVRPFNTYGPRQSARAIIPTLITQLLAGKTKISIGNTRPTRDLVYVKDTAKGFLKIAESNKLIGEEINISTQSEISIGDLAKMLILLINPEAEIKKEAQRIRPSGSEVYRLFGSNEKLKRSTGWSPEYSLEEGLAETIKWYKQPQNLELYNPHIYTI